MQQISGFQLYALLLLFQIGSTIVVGFASSSGRDAWMSSLFSGVLGVALLLLYTEIMRLHGGGTLIQWFQQGFGRWIGVPLSWVYPLTWIYVAGRVLAHFGDLINTTILPTTPLWVILGVFMLIVVYGLLQGIECLARLAEILLLTVFFLYFLQVILLISSRVVHLEYLVPVLDQGWGKVWQNVWPLGVTVPFGESLAFAMIWEKMKKPQLIRKVTLNATITYMFLLTSFNLLGITVLGEQVFQRSIYPLYELLSQLDVGGFLENLEPLATVYMCIMGFFKVSIFIYAATTAIGQLLQRPLNTSLSLLTSLGVGIWGYFMAGNVVQHIEAGLKIVPKLIWVPLFVVVPALLYLVSWFRYKKGL